MCGHASDGHQDNRKAQTKVLVGRLFASLSDFVKFQLTLNFYNWSRAFLRPQSFGGTDFVFLRSGALDLSDVCVQQISDICFQTPLGDDRVSQKEPPH